MMGTVVDKRMLAKALMGLSAGTGLLTKMVALGNDIDEVDDLLGNVTEAFDALLGNETGGA